MNEWIYAVTNSYLHSANTHIREWVWMCCCIGKKVGILQFSPVVHCFLEGKTQWDANKRPPFSCDFHFMRSQRQNDQLNLLPCLLQATLAHMQYAHTNFMVWNCRSFERYVVLYRKREKKMFSQVNECVLCIGVLVILCDCSLLF